MLKRIRAMQKKELEVWVLLQKTKVFNKKMKQSKHKYNKKI